MVLKSNSKTQTKLKKYEKLKYFWNAVVNFAKIF